MKNWEKIWMTPSQPRINFTVFDLAVKYKGPGREKHKGNACQKEHTDKRKNLKWNKFKTTEGV